MNGLVVLSIALLSALMPTSALPATAPDLPPEAQVFAALRSNPAVSAADEHIEAQEARARRLGAGPYEWTLDLGEQNRRVRSTAEGRYTEWDVGLERTVRLPGKRDLDQQLGAAGIATARVGRGEALHEAGRSLLAMWFDWLREESAVVQWRHQRDNLMQQARVLGRRVELGDAPRLERLQADAALAQAAAQLSQAEGRARVAAERLRRHHPLIALPVAVPEMPPDAVEGRADEWIETIVQHNHELGVARAESARARIIASRSDAERLPDPSFGIRLSRERSGEERLLGISLSVPLPGEGRRADSDAALADARASTHREAGVQRRVEAEAAALFRHAVAARSAWLDQRIAVEALARSADLTERAWQLGEGRLAETLAARRLAHEAQLAAQSARLDAREAYWRLMLDAHRLWALDEDAHPGHHPP